MLDKGILKEKLLSNSIRNDNGCLIWKGGTSGKYGSIHIGKDNGLTHRVAAYIYGIIDSIDDVRLVCHKQICKSKLCIEESHLYAGTQNDNMKDMVQMGNHRNQKKTHCKNGHILINRKCRICINKRYNELYRLRYKNNRLELKNSVEKYKK